MDSLEELEESLRLPEGQIDVISPLKLPVFPILVDIKSTPEVLHGFSTCSIFLVDNNIIVKVRNQYLISDITKPSDEILLDMSSGNFIIQDREKEIFESLKGTGHPNLVRKLDVADDRFAFFERLTPIKDIIDEANELRRRRWAIELVGAVAHLESIGYVPVNICAADIGVDRTGRLKLVGFGNSQRLPSDTDITVYEADPLQLGLHPNEVYRLQIRKVHQALVSCLHYILTGIDPDQARQGIMDPNEIAVLRAKVRAGESPVASEAMVISDVIQEAWMLKTTATLSEIARIVIERLNKLPGELEKLSPPLSERHYDALSKACEDWLEHQRLDPRWLNYDEYNSRCLEAGYNV